jgi:hypothetical protein
MAGFYGMGFDVYEKQGVGSTQSGGDITMRLSARFMVCVAATLMVVACNPSPEIATIGCERVLLGVWQSDGERTMAFNRARAKLQPRQDAFLATIVGKMTQEFDGRSVRSRMPDIEAEVDGKATKLFGIDTQSTYDVLFCDARMVVLKGTDAKTKKVRASVYHVVDKDLMWMYAGTNEAGIPDMHIREYFKRIR